MRKSFEQTAIEVAADQVDDAMNKLNAALGAVENLLNEMVTLTGTVREQIREAESATIVMNALS